MRPIIGTVARTAGGRGIGILSKLKFMFFTVFFAIILIQAIVISVQSKSIDPAIKEIGGRFLLTTENLGDQSRAIIDRGGVYNGEDGLLIGIWNVLKSLYLIFESLFVIYVWIKILSWIVLKVIIWDDSKTTTANLIAIIFFLSIQMLFIVTMTDKSPTTPFIALKDFVRAIPYMLSSTSPIADKLTEPTNIINNTINSTL